MTFSTTTTAAEQSEKGEIKDKVIVSESKSDGSIDSVKEADISVAETTNTIDNDSPNKSDSNKDSDTNMVREKDSFIDEQSSVGSESDVMSASNLPTYSSGGAGTNEEMSAFQLQPYDVNTDGSSVGGDSETTTPHSNADETNGPPSLQDFANTFSEQKMQSSNFRFKRSALISGATHGEREQVEQHSTGGEEEEEEDNDAEKSVDGISHANDIESGSNFNFASRITRSLWHQSSLKPRDLQQEDIASVIEDDQSENGEQKKMSRKERIFGEGGWVSQLKAKLRTKPVLIGIAVAVVLLLIIIISVTVSKRGKGGDGGGSAKGVGSSTPAPISMEDMYAKIHLAVSQLVDQPTLSESSSAESQALKWLLEEDVVWTHLHEDFSVERIQQRFVLVAFYFEMQGASWEANNWLQGDECGDEEDWNFINCNGEGQVRALSFDNVGLVGQIPSFIAHLPHVENFIIKKEAEVTGSIPAEIGHMDNLKQLGLYYTGLSGQIPKELFRASSLTFINLQNNNLEGGIPAEISNLKNLDTLVLMNNGLGGEIPWSSLASSGIRFLGLSNNGFHGVLPANLADLENLAYLYLDGNDIIGEIPTTIGQVKKLRSINLDNNEISGRLPVSIGQLSNLQYLSMQYNDITGPLPYSVRDMTALETIGLGSNNMSGKIPDLQSLINLQNLYLFDNRFTGPIPSDLFSLKDLRVLFLSSNIFSGSLPAPTKINTKLIGLYVSDNQLDGAITSSICNLRALQSIFIDENGFSGNLPDCLGLLKQLTQFHAFKNKLTGFIPHELSSLPALEEIGLEGNDLMGKVPDGLCNAVTDRGIEFWSDCGGDSPEVDCACCSMCCIEADNCATQQPPSA